jgi:hypothetical protein
VAAATARGGGEVRIVNTNGKMRIEGTGRFDRRGQAEKIARRHRRRGRELLPDRHQETAPTVSLETERMSGIMIGAAFEVRYHFRAPKHAVIN